MSICEPAIRRRPHQIAIQAEKEFAGDIVVRPFDGTPGEWDHFVRNHQEGTLFHTIAWRESIVRVFGHEPIFLSAWERNRLVGILPLYLVKSILGGRMLVSVPYGVGGGILARNARIAAALAESAKHSVDQFRCRSLDLRSERAGCADLPVVDRYIGFRRELPDRVEDVLPWLPRKARAAARNGRDKFGLTITFGDEHLPTVWRLYSQSMRRLASLNYPCPFFRELAANTPGGHWACVVRRGNRPVVGLMSFLFRDAVMPYFFGSTPESTRCSAANFAYFGLFQRAVAEGYRVFDFGRSRKENSGSADFKRFHGFEPRALEYQRYTPPGRTAPDLNPDNPRFDLARRCWRHIPLTITRPLGALLSRHIPG